MAVVCEREKCICENIPKEESKHEKMYSEEDLKKAFEAGK